MTATTERPSLWRNRDFTLLWSGQVISNLGAAISGTAMPLLVLGITGSPTDAGLVGAAGTLPHLIASLPAGPVVDRWDRRRLMIVAEVVAGFALLIVPLALWSGLLGAEPASAHPFSSPSLSTALLCLVAFVQGLCFVFFGLAERAALPLIVPVAVLPTAIAHNEARGRGAALAGPPLGGLLFGIDRSLPFLADGFSYLLAAGALVFLRRNLNPRRDPHNDLSQRDPDVRDPGLGVPGLREPEAASMEAAEPLWKAAVTGLRWIWRNPLVRAAILLLAVSNLVFQALVLVIVVLARQQGATAGGVGLMLGLYSVGGLLGALAAGRFHRNFTPRTVIVGINWVWVALLPLIVLTTHPLQIGVIGAACAFVGPLWSVVMVTYASVLVPNQLLGRVMSASMMLTWGVMPIASLGAGLLLSAVGPIGSVWVLAAVMLAAAVAGTASRAVRRAPPMPAG
ncbi:MFS transporter [Actinoplanes aureus]|uniref:MFS transporter n=1 Tax=Actinoplanes aureus TaxID=2792083 RepID=A0A931C7D7_9ACTN|nr:MFS transporter [Actinoplanes aureus]MBG0562742.1 MFS transporter [Actinoplanes aureus]